MSSDVSESMIHPSAIIHPAAKLGAGVSVGPYSIIGEHVEIGDNTTIAAHVIVTGRTRIGCDNRIYQFCSIGEVPQDKKYAGEPTRLEIGDRNTIRKMMPAESYEGAASAYAAAKAR